MKSKKIYFYRTQIVFIHKSLVFCNESQLLVANLLPEWISNMNTIDIYNSYVYFNKNEANLILSCISKYYEEVYERVKNNPYKEVCVGIERKFKSHFDSE